MKQGVIGGPASGRLLPKSLRCNHSIHPLAVGQAPPMLSWSLAARSHAEPGRALVQSAFQIRITESADLLNGRPLWDSGVVESSRTNCVVDANLSVGVGSQLCWSVRVFDRDGAASDWARAESFEIGPRGIQDFDGVWIGPSQNLFADPLPSMGDWIAPSPAVAEDGDLALSTVFELPDGYPRCFGMCWIAADSACRVTLNGSLVKNGCRFRLDHSSLLRLPWNHLKQGANDLQVIGPAASLSRGVSCLIRVHEAESGLHHFRSGPHWSCGAAPVSVLRERAPAPQPVENGPRRAVDLQKIFTLNRRPAAARVYATGLGAYELFINHQRVGDELLAPGWTEFDRRLHYAAHDVTGLLREGENRVVAVLGNGWWSSGLGWESSGRASRPEQTLRFLMDLVVMNPDEAPIRAVVSDASWAWRPSAISHDTIYHGQAVDLRFDDTAWRPVALLQDDYRPQIQPSSAEPIRVTGELKAKAITDLNESGYLFDFGQNHAGRPRLRARLPEGAKVRIRHCEALDDGDRPYFANYRTAAATDTVIAGDTPVDWSPSFTYRGYRYALLQGLPPGFTPDETTLCSQVLHNDVPVASEFRCSNELFNQIDRAVRWGLRSNLHCVPTDCPQRDERLGWTGDVQLFARTSCWLNNFHGFYRKWLQDLLDAQRGDGGITHIAPFTEVVPPDSAPAWGDIITILPRVIYEFYDDPSVLATAYASMKRWIAWLEARAQGGLALVGGFGDWVSVEDTPPELCGAAYYAHSTRIVADTARLLGYADEARQYEELARVAAIAFHRHFFDERTGCYRPGTQTAQVLPLAFDLTPAGLRQSVADRLADMVDRLGAKPSTGFIGTAYLLPVLTRFGHHELAYRTLNTREYPSLGYMIDQGATTIWEKWNTDKEGPDMNSRNHFCLGAMAQWLYEDLVGIKPDCTEPGLRRVRLEPRPAGDLRFVAFGYDTPQGRIDVRWEIDGEELIYDVTLPPNVRARLLLPSLDPGSTRAEGENASATDEGRITGHDNSQSNCSIFELATGQHRLRTAAAQLTASSA